MSFSKVRIAEDGSLVLDESSLTVEQEKSANVWETVDEVFGILCFLAVFLKFVFQVFVSVAAYVPHFRIGW